MNGDGLETFILSLVLRGTKHSAIIIFCRNHVIAFFPTC